jgi:hypothetical protein
MVVLTPMKVALLGPVVMITVEKVALSGIHLAKSRKVVMVNIHNCFDQTMKCIQVAVAMMESTLRAEVAAKRIKIM